ncbi:quinol monooxygenase YgiN [Microbacterium sp. W4I4]|uniref:antibiotic biosynthesis monooxygenase n=1 Tax=Microbacterium sp. W4I4 TaxID=3042295 RepID=UPI002781F54B|nr:antibiotic biosynthesis monooxygenase [Microbacterium sp. W4I4]MDQ0613435.1 quinol monooxygenase YgiN [Microbacterium sp. W4I4]
MYVIMSIHTPHPEHRDALVDSMRRFGAAMAGHEGLLSVSTMQDEASDRLVGLAIFESQDAANALLPLARAAVAGDDFGTWEAREIEGLKLIDITDPGRRPLQE